MGIRAAWRRFQFWRYARRTRSFLKMLEHAPIIGIHPNGSTPRCPRCRLFQTEDGHDPCIPNLPGVKNACCGHGGRTGYIAFENGVTVHGWVYVPPLEAD